MMMMMVMMINNDDDDDDNDDADDNDDDNAWVCQVHPAAVVRRPGGAGHGTRQPLQATLPEHAT
jgi:hypothetical protein